MNNDNIIDAAFLNKLKFLELKCSTYCIEANVGSFMFIQSIDDECVAFVSSTGTDETATLLFNELPLKFFNNHREYMEDMDMIATNSYMKCIGKNPTPSN